MSTVFWLVWSSPFSLNVYDYFEVSERVMQVEENCQLWHSFSTWWSNKSCHNDEISLMTSQWIIWNLMSQMKPQRPMSQKSDSIYKEICVQLWCCCDFLNIDLALLDSIFYRSHTAGMTYICKLYLFLYECQIIRRPDTAEL